MNDQPTFFFKKDTCVCSYTDFILLFLLNSPEIITKKMSHNTTAKFHLIAPIMPTIKIVTFKKKPTYYKAISNFSSPIIPYDQHGYHKRINKITKTMNQKLFFLSHLSVRKMNNMGLITFISFYYLFLFCFFFAKKKKKQRNFT
jgi:hypothetical protein